MKVRIHTTAIVAETAELGEDVHVGPYCVVGPRVKLGDRVDLKSHVVIEGNTTVGEDTVIYPFASIGHRPQDLKYKGEESELIIGARCQIREHVTMNPGTADDKMKTVVGDDGLFMVGVHIAHDCVVGNNVIMSNNATLAGHVDIGDHVIIGGLAAVRQFVRIGNHAMIGGMAGVVDDVIPYGLVLNETSSLAGLNLIGLQRRGFNKDQISTLRKAYEYLFSGEGTMAERLKTLAADYANDDVVGEMLRFAQTPSKAPSQISLCQPKKTSKSAPPKTGTHG